jgi:HSP20 family molecular chaperone IbpA
MVYTVDIFDEGTRVQVIAEFPGVNENTITHSVAGNHLILNAVKGTCRIHKKTDPGSPVKEIPRHSIQMVSLNPTLPRSDLS